MRFVLVSLGAPNALAGSGWPMNKPERTWGDKITISIYVEGVKDDARSSRAALIAAEEAERAVNLYYTADALFVGASVERLATKPEDQDGV